MRHFGSLVLAVLLAPAIWLLLGYGQIRYGHAYHPGSLHVSTALLVALGLLTTGAALYGVLVLARLSPLGPVLAGLIFVGITAWLFVRPEALPGALPSQIIHDPVPVTAPAGPLALVLAVPLLATLFSPRRWRRRATPAGAPGDDSGYPVPTEPTPIDPFWPPQQAYYGAEDTTQNLRP